MNNDTTKPESIGSKEVGPDDTRLKVDFSTFDNTDYSHGQSKLVFYLWHLVNTLVFRNGLLGSSAIRVKILRLFGAKIGEGVVMNKPNVNIKYPWKLTIGDHSWLGENSWIYNMDEVVIGANVNIAQGVMLLTGNHNIKSTKFEVFTKPITVEEGCFIGAHAVICPGVTCHSHSVLTVNSTARKDMQAYTIYSGNPAEPIGTREIS